LSNLDRILARIDEVLASEKFESGRAWCRAAGVSEGYIGALRTKYATGEATSARIDQIEKLAIAAGVSLDYMLGRDKLKPAEPGSTTTSPRRPEQPVATNTRRKPALTQAFEEAWKTEWWVQPHKTLPAPTLEEAQTIYADASDTYGVDGLDHITAKVWAAHFYERLRYLRQSSTKRTAKKPVAGTKPVATTDQQPGAKKH